jgi:hypothetical protein
LVEQTHLAADIFGQPIALLLKRRNLGLKVGANHHAHNATGRTAVEATQIHLKFRPRHDGEV